MRASLQSSAAGPCNKANGKKSINNYSRYGRFKVSHPRAGEPAGNLRSTYGAPTEHLRSTYGAPTEHLRSTYGAPTEHLRST